MTRFPLKRLFATVLPISFVWLFVACVSICTRESKEKHIHNTAILSTEVKDASDCEDCPLSSFQKATIPERSTFYVDLQTPLVVGSLISSLDSLVDHVALVPHYGQPQFADLPLKRLPLLRI